MPSTTRARSRGSCSLFDGDDAVLADLVHRLGDGAVTGLIGGLGRDLLHHLRAHVLELVFDFLGHGHAILGHRGRTKGLIEDHVAALRAKGHFDRIG